MSDFSDFLRKQEDELKATRDKENQRRIKESEDAALLKRLVEEEWPVLINTLHSLVANESFDGKHFHWNDRTLSLGNMTLTVYVKDLLGFGQNDYYVTFWRMGHPKSSPDKLRPALSNGTLVWSCAGVNLGSDKSTGGVAVSLIRELVSRYKAAANDR